MSTSSSMNASPSSSPSSSSPRSSRRYLYWRSVRGAARFVGQLWLGLRVEGRDRVPREGGLIVASNHASYADPPLVCAAVPRVVHFLAKEELFRNPLFGAFIRSLHSLPIRRGELLPEQHARAVNVLKNGGALIMFPEGTRSRDGKPGRPRPGVAIFARDAGVPIVPAHVSGSPGWMWGILRGKRVTIRFGDPVPPPSPGAGREELVAVTAEVMRRVWSLTPGGPSIQSSTDTRSGSPRSPEGSDLP